MFRLFVIIFLSVAAASHADYDLRIAASSSLQLEAIRIATEAKRELNLSIEVISGSTSKLAAQIAEGAPFDFFLSADPQILPHKERFEIEGGRLLLWSYRPRNDLGDAAALVKRDFNRLAISDPALTPYGRASMEVMRRLGLAESSQVVRAQNVAQGSGWLTSGSVDLALVAASQFEGGAPQMGSYWLVPLDWHQPIQQQWLRVNTAESRFWDWLKSRPSSVVKRENSETKQNYFGLSSDDWKSLGVTLQLAFVSTVLLVLGGVPLVWVLYIWRRRVWARICRALIALPLTLPPTVLGFYLLIFFSGTSLKWAFTFKGLVIGSMLYSLPFVLQPIYSSLEQLGGSIFEQAASLGLRPTQLFLRVAVPLLRPSIFAGALLGFAHTLGEFGVVLMIGGGISGRTRVASVAIYEHVEAMRYAEAHRMAAILLVLSFAMILCVQFFQKRHSSPSAV